MKNNNKIENKVHEHELICNALRDMYRKKNTDYNDSFGKMFEELGIITAVTRIGDKYERVKSLSAKENLVENESVQDTLFDMANYCIMTLIELQEQRKAIDKNE